MPTAQTAPVTTKPRRKNGVNKDTARSGLQARKGIDTSTGAGAALVDPNKPLTDKQRLFVKFWAQGESIISASMRAGYNDGATYAYRMVRMPNILKLYRAEKEAYEAAAQMTRKKVMDGLLEGIEMAKLVSEPASVISGWREIGKMCGYYEPVTRKLDITVNGNVVMERMNRLSDAELLKLIQEGVQQAAPALEGPDDDDEDEDS